MIGRKLVVLELEKNLSKRVREDDLVSLIYISNNDSRVQYTQHWNTTQKTSSTTVSGSQSSLRFNGSLITVYGVVPMNGSHNRPPSASYLIDGTLIVQHTQNYSTNQGSHRFFTSEKLASTFEHTLTINVTDAASGYVLDYFAVTTVENPAPTPPLASVHSGLSKPSMIGAIVGTVAGSILLLSLAFVIWFKYLRNTPSSSPPPPSPPPVIGYTAPSPRNSSVHGTMFTSTASILYGDPPASLKMDQLSTRGEQSEAEGDPPKTPGSCSDISTLRFAYDVP